MFGRYADLVRAVHFRGTPDAHMLAIKPGELELISSQISTTGVIIARYRPAGPVRTGSFQLAEPSGAEIVRRAKMKLEG